MIATIVFISIVFSIFTIIVMASGQSKNKADEKTGRADFPESAFHYRIAINNLMTLPADGSWTALRG